MGLLAYLRAGSHVVAGVRIRKRDGVLQGGETQMLPLLFACTDVVVLSQWLLHQRDTLGTHARATQTQVP